MNPTTKTTKHAREDEVARATVDAALMVHRTLGPGLLESVHEKCLAAELIERGFAVEVIALLINFNTALLKDGIKRLAL